MPLHQVTHAHIFCTQHWDDIISPYVIRLKEIHEEDINRCCHVKMPVYFPKHAGCHLTLLHYFTFFHAELSLTWGHSRVKTHMGVAWLTFVDSKKCVFRLAYFSLQNLTVVIQYSLQWNKEYNTQDVFLIGGGGMGGWGGGEWIECLPVFYHFTAQTWKVMDKLIIYCSYHFLDFPKNYL